MPSTSSAPGPLSNIRVLDCATFLAAPLAAATLAEFGAEVIKIEQPGEGDSLRRFGTPTEVGDSLVWLSESRNKSSMTLDLRQPEGVALFKKLVAEADVVCENFRPGTMDKWGLGYDVLREINPGIVMLQVSGYGQEGPYRNRPVFARIAHAFSGLSHLAGMPGGAPVTPGSTSLADYMTGIYGAFAIMVALRHRDVPANGKPAGEGQKIDLALFEPVFRALDDMVPTYLMNGDIRGPQGVMTSVACPHGHFKAKDGRWLAIACTSDKMYARLCEAMERPELADPDMFGPVKNRLAQAHQVEQTVAKWVQSFDRDTVMQVLQQYEVPSSPINNVVDLVNDPQIQQREVLVTLADEILGDITIPNVVPRLSATPGAVTSLGPRLGEANDRILSTLLGLSEEEIADLKARKIV